MDCERKLPLQKGRFEINYKVVLYAQAHISHIPTMTYHRCNLYHPLMHGTSHSIAYTQYYENYLLSIVNCTDLSSSSDSFQDHIIALMLSLGCSPCTKYA